LSDEAPTSEAFSWLGLRPGQDPGRFRMDLPLNLCRPGGVLFGGSGAAAVVAVAEAHTGQRTLWSHVQFAGEVTAPGPLDFHVDVLASGKTVSQVAVSGKVGGEIVLSGSASVTATPDGLLSAVDLEPPDVPPPDDSRPRYFFADQIEGSINDYLDVRIARGRTLDELDGTPDVGCVLWARAPEEVPMGSASLALLADHIPFAVSQAVGRPVIGPSLDSSIRFVRTAPTDWVLIDIKLTAIGETLAHGRASLFSSAGELLATTEQSMRVREV
jgi:acyl-CoA thioesterase-2